MERMESEDIADAIAYIVTRPRRVAINEILIRPTEQQQAPGVFSWPRRRRYRAAPAEHGHLLSPSRPRDRRLVLLLRSADLSRLHDRDTGRHALPECARQRTKVRTSESIRSLGRGRMPVTMGLIIVNVFMYLLEIAGGSGGLNGANGTIVGNLALIGHVESTGQVPASASPRASTGGW